MIRFIFIIQLAAWAVALPAQPYAPPAGQEGSTALHLDSELFIDWADSCLLSRGPGIITYPDSVSVTHGVPGDATGKAGEGRVVSLGDGGSATMYFNRAVQDGPGYDFAVFENAFSETFLELAFVEVSSDGERFHAFPAHSLTQTEFQVPGFGEVDTRNINNMAGKYLAGYGTPFDLRELTDAEELDLNRIHWIKVTDAVGILDDSLGTRDALGNLVNDPWPTPYKEGGFDLDAVGVIGTLSGQKQGARHEQPVALPNPFHEGFTISGTCTQYRLYDSRGLLCRQGRCHDAPVRITASQMPPGIYLLIIDDQDPVKMVKKQ